MMRSSEHSDFSFAMQHAQETCGAFLWALDEADGLTETNAPVMDIEKMADIFRNARTSCLSLGFPFFWREEGQIYYVTMMDRLRKLYLIGPLATGALSHKEELAYANQHGIDPKAVRIPAVSASQAVNCAVTVCYLTTGTAHSKHSVQHVNKIISDLYTKQWIEYRMRNQGTEHLPYEYEQKWITRVFSDPGYYENANLDEMRGLSQGVGKLAESQFKQVEYQTITALTLISRAAIRHGMSPQESYTLSDVYYQRLEKCSTVEDLERVYRQSISAFSGMTRHWQESRARGSITQQCCQYVNSHLYDVLTLESIAEHLGVSKNYLSTLFTREKGQTLYQYIHEKRLDHASELLRYTNTPIGEIAQQLMFSSQSHFGKLFKEHFGITPQRYRHKYGANSDNL